MIAAPGQFVTASLVLVALLLVVGLYCLVVSRNLIRILIGLEILTKAVTLLLALGGDGKDGCQTVTFAPLGPYLVTGLVPADLTVIGRVNGREVQRCSPRDMFFDVPALVSWISRSIALEPGDLVYTGTSGSPAELADGDVVEVEIAGIGVLTNPVRAGA